MTRRGQYSARWRRGSIILTMAALTGVVAVNLVIARGPGAVFDHAWPPSAGSSSLLEHRLAAVDAAVERGDLLPAMTEWREAFGAAFRTRRWDAMADVGDAALRVDVLARRDPDGQGFRVEARRAYLQALLLARATGSEQGVARVADAFASLGDAQVAVQARTLLEVRR